MEIQEVRRVLRRYDLSMRKRDTALAVSNKDCPYEVRYKREWMFNINPEQYRSVEEVEHKIKHEMREEYIPPLG